MITLLKAVYEGDGVFRLLETPPDDLVVNQQVQVEIAPIENLLDDEMFAPSEQAVWEARGMYNVSDPALALYLAENDELDPWNAFLDEQDS